MKHLAHRLAALVAALAITLAAVIAVGAATEQEAHAAWGYPATLDCLAVISTGPTGSACFARQDQYNYDLWRKSSVGIVYNGRYAMSFDNTWTLTSATNNLFANSGYGVWAHGNDLFAWGWVAVARSSCNTNAGGWYLCLAPGTGTYPGPGNALGPIHVRQ